MNTIETDFRFAIIPEWVLDANISSRAIQCYAILARYADNDSGQAFPSRSTLAKRMRCGVKVVDRSLSELVTIKAIEKHIRIENNNYSTSVYVVKKASLRVGSKMTPPSVKNDTRVGSKMTHRTITNELELLNYKKQFDSFWDRYPKKVDKRVAEKAFEKALKRVEFDELLAGVDRYRDDPNRKPEFTKNPSTWLNADAWANEALPSGPQLNEWGKPFAKPAEGPAVRAWVKKMHDLGEHWECRAGEFGCQ